MRLIELRKATAPLKEEIERLREELLDRQYQHNKTVRQLQDTHLRQLASVTAATAAAPVKGSVSKFTVGEAITKYLNKPMKPRARKRFIPTLAHFENFAGGALSLDTMTQARYAEYADVVNANPAWTIATKKLYITVAGTMLRWHWKRGEPIEQVSAGSLVLARRTPHLGTVTRSPSSSSE